MATKTKQPLEAQSTIQRAKEVAQVSKEYKKAKGNTHPEQINFRAQINEKPAWLIGAFVPIEIRVENFSTKIVKGYRIYGQITEIKPNGKEVQVGKNFGEIRYFDASDALPIKKHLIHEAVRNWTIPKDVPKNDDLKYQIVVEFVVKMKASVRLRFPIKVYTK